MLILFHQQNQLQLQLLLEKSSDVIVKIGAAGVCRTDLHIIEGVWKHIQDPDDKLLPCVMGHENAGWIEEVGKDVTNFKKGDQVILHLKIILTFGTKNTKKVI